jgi:hypothetical protein
VQTNLYTLIRRHPNEFSRNSVTICRMYASPFRLRFDDKFIKRRRIYIFIENPTAEKCFDQCSLPSFLNILDYFLSKSSSNVRLARNLCNEQLTYALTFRTSLNWASKRWEEQTDDTILPTSGRTLDRFSMGNFQTQKSIKQVVTVVSADTHLLNTYEEIFDMWFEL